MMTKLKIIAFTSEDGVGDAREITVGVLGVIDVFYVCVFKCSLG